MKFTHWLLLTIRLEHWSSEQERVIRAELSKTWYVTNGRRENSKVRPEGKTL